MIEVPNRRPDWEPRLLDYLRTVHHEPFRYGHHDCLLFTLGAVDAMTGSALADKIKGRYTEDKASWDIGKEFGFTSPMHFISRTFLPRASRLSVMRGDIVAIKTPELPRDIALGICQGANSYVVGHQGLAIISNAFMRKGFAV